MAPTMAPVAETIDAPETARHGAGDLRFILRDATEAAHRRLDAGFAAHDLTRRADYGVFLSAMNAAFAPLEAWLDAVDPALLPADWPARRRAEALSADLAGLGIAVPDGSRDAPPPTPPAAEAPGILYVLEGSRLGGQVLLRRVLAGPDAALHANTRFLRHGEGRRFWPSFGAWLATRPACARDDAIRGALRAFALFEAAGTGR